MNKQQPDIELCHHLNEPQLLQLHKLYQNEWWSQKRKLADIRKMLAATDIILALVSAPEKRVAAFARILTDDTYLALILDVIVAPDYRGQGVGRLLMDSICAHPRVQGVKSLELVCQPELIPFYRRWGFSEQVGRSLLMRRTAHKT